MIRDQSKLIRLNQEDTQNINELCTKLEISNKSQAIRTAIKQYNNQLPTHKKDYQNTKP